MRRDVFQALADPVRRDIIKLLVEKTLSVSAISDKFEISRPAISKHLKILKECQVISIQKIGRERFCSLSFQNLYVAFQWFDPLLSYWDENKLTFENFLKKLPSLQPDTP